MQKSYLVPEGERLGQLLVVETAHNTQHIIRFADQLHVPILDAVVHHLNEVAAATGTNVHDAWAIVHLHQAWHQVNSTITTCWMWIQFYSRMDHSMPVLKS